MKKTFILIISLLLLIGCTSKPSLKLEYPDKIDLKITSETGLIKLQLDKDESKEFVDQINNLEITECIPKIKEPIIGWSLYAHGLNKDNQDVFQISFTGSLVNYYEEYYQADKKELEKIINNYK